MKSFILKEDLSTSTTVLILKPGQNLLKNFQINFILGQLLKVFVENARIYENIF